METKKKKYYPTISVVIATYNSAKTIEKCLKSIRIQNYPQQNLKIIIADGASKDDTLQIARKFNTEVINVPPRLQNAEYNKGVGVRKAKGDLILMVDHDNILPHRNWLKNMVEPLLRNKKIVAVETLRYHYDPAHTVLDRYFALFGAAEPIVFYFGKTDRLSYIYDTYNLYGASKDCGKYYEVTFSPEHISTLGANGFLIRRGMLKHAKIDRSHFYHIDINVDLIKKGFNTYAFVKDDIIHLTGYSSIRQFIRRKMLFMKQFHIHKSRTRRYSVYMPGDELKLVRYIIYSVTFIKPTIDAVRGYRKVRDSAWFLHPVLSFLLAVVYGYTTLQATIKNYE